MPKIWPIQGVCSRESSFVKIYQTLRSVYQSVFPERVRRSADGLLSPLKSRIRRIANHDELYDKAYFEDGVEPTNTASAAVMAQSILDEFHPGFVVDVGCGTGGLLLALKKVGVPGMGFENASAAIEIARSKGLEVVKLDLERPIDRLEIRRADLCTSTEVAEHIPERFADTFVDYLCRTADQVLLTAAHPGQGGLDHVNEQPNEYWIAKFQARGFPRDAETTARMRSYWEANKVAGFYHQNLMLFRRAEAR
jgi:SAM-dependent methyltransferase